jgi:hypothetical protein
MNLEAIDITGLIILIIVVAAIWLLLRVVLRLSTSLLRLGCLIAVLVVVAYVVFRFLNVP